jgi:glycerol uptake facilitator-like aquaporin
MRKINLLAVIVAAFAAFVASAVYYTLLVSTWLRLRGIDQNTVSTTPHVWEMVGQLVRNFVVSFVFAYFIMRLKIVGWKDSLCLGLWVWIGFQAMQIAGAVLHEDYPLGLYALHIGDALMTTLIMTTIIGAWTHKRENSYVTSK